MGAVRHDATGNRTMLPSDLHDLEHRYGLTVVEAEKLWGEVHLHGQPEEATAAAIKAARVVYRDSYDARPR